MLWDPLELPGVEVLNYTVFYTPVEFHLPRGTKESADALSDLLQVFPANVTYGFVSNLVSNHSYQFRVAATMNIGGDVFVGDRTGSIQSNESYADIRLVADAVSPMIPTSRVCLTVGSLSAAISATFVVVLLLVVVAVAVAVMVVHLSLSKKRRYVHHLQILSN